MRAWPPHLHEAAAALPDEVEQTGKWPTELGGPLGILLEKGGTTDPMDRRPIWLMPMIYRSMGEAEVTILGQMEARVGR